MAWPAQVNACTMVWRPFGFGITPYTLALKAIPAVEFSRYDDKGPIRRFIGTLKLRNISCTHRPKSVATCPKTFDVAFDEIDDGANCGFALTSMPRGNESKLRHFLFVQRNDGSWALTNVAKTLWGRS